MIKCLKCNKENQDHYKFCLGCGAELPKNAPREFQPESPAKPEPAPAVVAPPVVTAPTKQDAVPVAPAPAPAAQAPAPAAQAPAPATQAPAPATQAPVPQAPAPAPAAQASAVVKASCPQCGHENAVGNRFCAACGYKLGGSAAAVIAPTAAATSKSGISLTALRADGSEAGIYTLPPSPTVTVGRDTGTIFAGDSYLSPRHATFTIKGTTITVRDEGSLNGVYVKLTPNQPFPLDPGAVFRIGQEIVRFEALGAPTTVDGVDKFGSPAKGIIGRLALVIGRDTTGNAFPIPARGLHLGRERGDVLFSEDGYVSGLHCQVAPGEGGKVFLTDVGSSNGTFVRVRENHRLSSGDILLMGQQVFRLDVA